MAQRTLAQAILSTAFAAMAIAVGTAAIREGNAISSTLFVNWDLNENTSDLLTHAWGFTLIASGIAGVHRRAWLAHLATAFLMTLLMWARTVQAEISPLLIPISQTSRYLAPVALALLASRLSQPVHDKAASQQATAIWILRLAAATTFLGHGTSALHHNSSFADLIFAACQTGLDLEPAQASVLTTLTFIGVTDILLAVLCLATRLRWPLVLMAVWGTITAASRLVHGGLESWEQALERLPNAAIPLSMLILTRPTCTSSSIESRNP